MPRVIEPRAVSPADGFAVVVSRYNESITGKLLSGAVETLRSAGVADDRITVAHVPGAWEIPLVARQMAVRQSVRAVLCLGAVIRGETTHDRYINRSVSLSLQQIALEQNKPVLFGILTCQSLDQAIQRSGGRVGNKGIECAREALEMVGLCSALTEFGDSVPAGVE
jgi:6,7-dimethyl-8-ribityllumazine synthase